MKTEKAYMRWTMFVPEGQDPENPDFICLRDRGVYTTDIHGLITDDPGAVLLRAQEMLDRLNKSQVADEISMISRRFVDHECECGNCNSCILRAALHRYALIGLQEAVIEGEE